MSNTYVIDGSNLCRLNGNTSIQPLLTILIAILENNDSFYCYFDANIINIFESSYLESRLIKNLIDKFTNNFSRTTGGSRADTPILHNAHHNNRNIITNDRYRDYKEKYPWLKDDYTPRLIQSNLHSGNLLTVEKLPYGHLTLIDDVEAAFNCLEDLLKYKSKCGANLKQTRIGELSSDTHLNNSSTQLISQRSLRNIEEIRKANQQNQQEKEQKEQAVADAGEDYEQECINKASEALSKHLKLQICESHIPFNGGSWDVAVRRLEILFFHTPLCGYCYHLGFADGAVCRHCGRSCVTENPKPIWEVIEKYAPDSDARKFIRKKINSGLWQQIVEDFNSPFGGKGFL